MLLYFLKCLRNRQLRFLIFVIILVFLFSYPKNANAWKPVTHVYLAELALLDALDDGKVTICRVNYALGTVIMENENECEVIGTYEVEENILEALRRYPDQFRAGVIGPDAYPDIITGQQLIHIDSEEEYGRGKGPNTNDWLVYLWERSQDFPYQNSYQVKAFVVGYLTHAAGDMYGHTFVNNYSGGNFEFAENNAIKHIVLEGYIGKRTPSPTYSISISGVDHFIYREMVYARPHSTLRRELFRGPGIEYSLPKILSDLRIELWKDVRGGCNFYDVPCHYKKAWVDDIDDCLEEWPHFSHEIAEAITFNSQGSQINRAKDAAGDYFEDYLLSCLGAPDWGIDIVFPALDFLGLGALLDQIQDDLINYLSEEATGMTVDELGEFLTNPELYFDDVMDGGIGENVTLVEMNEFLKLNDPGFPDPGQPVERFDYINFPAAYNTVVMTKLLLLKPSEVNRLLDDLGSSVEFNENLENPMLGFLRTLDGANGWVPESQPWDRNPPNMILADDMNAYRQIFMKVFPIRMFISENITMPEWSSASNISILENDSKIVLFQTEDPNDSIVDIRLGGLDFVSLIEKNEERATVLIEPDFSHAGLYDAQLVIDTIFGEVIQDIPIRVINVNRAPQLQEIMPILVEENSELIVNITAYDPDESNNPSLTFEMNPDLHFVELNPTSGDSTQIILTPDYEISSFGMNRSFTTVLSVNDIEGAQTQESINITVLNVNRPPEFNIASAIVNVKEGQQKEIEIEVSDADGQDIQLVLPNSPEFIAAEEVEENKYKLVFSPNYKDAGSYTVSASAIDPEDGKGSLLIFVTVENQLLEIATEVIQKQIQYQSNQYFGLIELQVSNLQPNLSSQVQMLTQNGWENVVNSNNDNAWFHDTIQLDNVIKYTYGQNAVGGTYRWVIHDKEETHNEGWVVSEPFQINMLGKHIIIQISLPEETKTRMNSVN